jgi:Flp pilus assembly protein TadG
MCRAHAATPGTRIRDGISARDASSGERGSASVELVLATPILVALMLLAVAGGRLASSRGEVDAAARDSARAASLARSPAAAERDGQAAAEATLADRGITCQNLGVTIDLSDFRPGGSVASTVVCAVGLGDLTGLGLPGHRTVTATFAAPVDRYRGVTR